MSTTYIQNESGVWTAWLDEFPGILTQAGTKQECDSKLSATLSDYINMMTDKTK